MKILRRITPFVLVIISLLVVSCSDSAMGPDGDNGNSDNGDSESYSHTRNPGTSANDFLADSNYTELTVEIDFMEGYDPNEEALASLKTFLEERLNKTSVTILEPTQISSGGQDHYSASEVRDLEDQHRDNFTEGEKLAAYMIIVDGKYEQDNVLGIAYYNTSNAFFGVAYDEVSGGVGQPSRYKTEATSFRHEFGHLFGLVGIPNSGTEMQENHKDPDPDHGNHCDDDTCLMYYAMESTDVFGSFFGGEIPSLDQNCIDDLQANGGK
ncbi:hypothetical protein NC796_24670 [Aliifodinibius sp. S!AR15-10]|uniref:hypothetical protein n=1 Tax=Aliifodinibius sp. S!AR15-10 TaxID=2950437 RepID=UPI00285F7E37|nr:hypothetical protein [Aliifodinibius sp. S!AR15-10]MDR8394366.1 hypothetical protein [Aliifodinibius sp. S!AR15-10]